MLVTEIVGHDYKSSKKNQQQKSTTIDRKTQVAKPYLWNVFSKHLR